ncbi:class I SAM-dependent RNA methyltransferase [bacterium]|nr:class I SAM-dependent RNA methyltransferase [bacterium]
MSDVKTCPFFGVCGGCAIDFAATDYISRKEKLLPDINMTSAPVWTAPGARRRGDFCFAGNRFGLYQRGSKDIVPVRMCPNMVPEINSVLGDIAAMPWSGAGSCLITACDNGIDISITSSVPYFTPEFKRAADKLPRQILRVTWNDRAVVTRATPIIKFDDVSVEYPPNAFLQPGVPGERALRQMVVHASGGARRVADLFCGLGNFTYALNADGFDIVGVGHRRDLFKNPLTPGMLNTYDCVVMDPPRAGAMAQCNQIVKSNVSRVIYVSCNPSTFMRDAKILTDGGYHMTHLVPVDQFVGSTHWELFSVFEK